MKMKNKEGHQDNGYIYNIFGVLPCKNCTCKNYVKLDEIIKYKFSKLSKNNEGYCYACHHIERAKQLQNGQILGVYDDIDKCITLTTNVEDIIPDGILHEFIELYKFILSRINNASDEQQIILYNKLLILAPKVVLARQEEWEDGSGL